MAADLESARLWRSPDSTRLVLDLSAAVDHQLIVLKNPDRLVIDISNITLKTAFDQLDLGKTPIAKIRSAVRNKTDLRVVLDLKSLVNPKSFSLKSNEEKGETEKVEPEKEIKEEKPIPTKKALSRVSVSPVTQSGKSSASPKVRKFARELGADVSRVPGTQRSGRVSEDDVKEFIRSQVTVNHGEVQKKKITKHVEEYSHEEFGEIIIKDIPRVKRLSGPHLVRSWTEIPHVTQHEEIDITEMEQFRSSLYDYYTGEKIKVTPLAFVAKALVSALKEFPNFNSSIDTDSNKITYKKYFHLGFAVDTPHGLMVPKIRNVDQMSIQKIGDELRNTSKLCRELKIDKKEFFGGSMTISSLGGIGGTHFTPIINPPEVAILGVGKNFDRLVKEKGKIVSKKILPISLSYDHRIIDGAEGARFCVYLGKCLGKDFAFKLAV